MSVLKSCAVTELFSLIVGDDKWNLICSWFLDLLARLALACNGATTALVVGFTGPGLRVTLYHLA